jgi:hypothetical protein
MTTVRILGLGAALLVIGIGVLTGGALSYHAEKAVKQDLLEESRNWRMVAERAVRRAGRGDRISEALRGVRDDAKVLEGRIAEVAKVDEAKVDTGAVTKAFKSLEQKLDMLEKATFDGP